jgi:NADPH2:quinone reductase
VKAIVINRFGGPEVFEPAEVPTPELRPGHVLVRVAASSVNPIDCKIRSGAVTAVAPEFPAVLHCDLAGTVEALGPGVTCFKPGDAVYALAGGIKGHGGALAELMLVDADLLALKPESLSLAEAAALPVAAVTAWEAVVERAAVRPGRRVLVHGGAGGVGHMALQLARVAGAVVHTTVSTSEKAEIARSLGADVTIRYREKTVEQYVEQHTGGRGFDVVIDTVGGDVLTRSLQAARAGGTVVTIAARSTQDLTPVHGKGLTLHAVLSLLPLLTGEDRGPQGRILTEVARLIDAGRIRPLIDPSHFPFSRVGEAHAHLEEGRAVGKIRLTADFAD